MKPYLNGYANMNVMKIQFLWLIIAIGLIGGCASNKTLFAEYDHLCESHSVALIANASSVSYSVQATESSGTSYPVADLTNQNVIWHPAVYFNFDNAALTAEERTRINDNIAVLRAHPSLKLQLRGFADQQGEASYNNDLSLRRAESVLSFIVSAGVDKSRVSLVNLGESLPIAANRRIPDYQINRRVEFFLLDSSGVPVPVIFSGPAS